MKKYKVIMVARSVKKDMYLNLSYEEALAICEDFNWECAPDGGFVWDLEIEEEW